MSSYSFVSDTAYDSSQWTPQWPVAGSLRTLTALDNFQTSVKRPMDDEIRIIQDVSLSRR